MASGHAGSAWWMRRMALPSLGQAVAGTFVTSVRGVAPLSALLLLALLLQARFALAAPLALQVVYAASFIYMQAFTIRCKYITIS